MDPKPLTVDGTETVQPTYPQLEKLIEDRVRAAAAERGIGSDIFQSALGFPGKTLENGILDIVLRIHNAAMFGEQIAACNFGYLYGAANHPEQIEGQTAHQATGNTELDHPGQTLTTQQVWESNGDGDLSEFLDYLCRNPGESWIGIVWKVDDQFWSALVHSRGSDRNLHVDRDPPDARWRGHCRFVRGKSAEAQA